MREVEAGSACAACGRSLPVRRGKGRPQQYCNATCRSAARRLRNREDATRTIAVKSELTDPKRHDRLDVMLGTDSGAAAASGQAGPQSALAGIAAARQQVAAAEAELQQAVDRARAAGHSWREIGDVLETTRQAAFQRFGRPVDPRTGAPMSRAVLPGAADTAIMIFADMAAGRWEDARRDFSEPMRSRLDADHLAAGWAQTIGMIGSFERVGEPLAYPAADFTVVDIPLHFEAGDRTGRVSFDRDGRVAGLFIRPASA
jgi:Protein of unknown function (DUF3887)